MVALLLFCHLAPSFTWGLPTKDQGRAKLVDARTAIAHIGAHDPETKIENAENAFNRNMRSFIVASTAMPPQTAAAKWLALVDEGIAIPHRSFNGGLGGYGGSPIGSLYTVLITLPKPEDWPEIQALAIKRPPSLDRTALLILCARLLGKNEELIRLCEQYEKQLPKPEPGNSPQEPTLSIRIAALRRLGRLSEPANIRLALTNMRGEVPTLADLIPRDSAKAVMLDLIKDGEPNFDVRNRENRKLAQEVVLDHLSELKSPAWYLVRDPDDLPYTQRLVEHYGTDSLTKSTNYARGAEELLFRSFVLAGRLDEATKLAQGLSNPIDIDSQAWIPAPAGLVQSIETIQSRVSGKDLWKLYVHAAIAARQIPRAIERLKSRIADETAPREERLQDLALLLGLHARTGNRQGIEADCDEAKRIRQKPDDFDPVYDILKIGLASEDHELIAKGIAHDLDQGYANPGLSQALAMEGELADLEHVQLQQLRNPSTEIRNSENTIGDLCATYWRANRPADILKLLNEFPFWSQRDVSGLIANQGRWLGTEDGEPSVGYFAAWALSKTGQKDLALRALRGVLLADEGAIAAYTLLNQLGDAGTLKTYDELIQAHHLDARPILWKGDLLLQLGKVAEAEQCVAQAQRLNAADGFLYREKLNGLRAQFYFKKGDLKGVTDSSDLANAAKLGARGEKLLRAGLLDQATDVLKQAVGMCPDDAELQAQLAECLYDECLPTEAEAHYRKAFENMPADLGEESDGPEALTKMLEDSRLAPLGIDILSEIVKRQPNNAEAHFALGLLNGTAGYSQESVAELKLAVKNDPRHIRAWQELADRTRIGLVSPAVAQNIEFKIIELAPEQELGARAFDLVDVSDLGAAYHKLQQTFLSLPSLDRRPLMRLHTDSELKAQIAWPKFGRLDPSGRLAGGYFQASGDIQSIAGLYHPTRYPFD